MNPQIRYGDPSQYANGIKFSYDEIRPIDRMSFQDSHENSKNNYQYQAGRQQIGVSQPILMRHKSNNTDLNFYQETNFTQSYRLESTPSSAFVNQDNNTYKSTNYVNHRENLHKFETVNDFFTVAVESIKIQEKFRKDSINNSQPIKYEKNPNQPDDIFFHQISRNQLYEEVKAHKFQSNSEECQKCQQYQKQNERIMTFMREQLEIGVKQFNDRMNKIIVQQAKEIKDLRKSLINNEKQLISFHKNSQNQNQKNFKAQRSISPSVRGATKQRSPSKLSLTKSNTSISQNYVSKQKITMVSKGLSPSKISADTNSKRPEKQNSFQQQQRLFSTIQMPSQLNLTFEQISRKIKVLEEHVQFLCKLEDERNERTFFMNKKIETLEKGFVSYFGAKTSKFSKTLNNWMISEEERLKELYNEMKIISSRVGTMSSNSSNALKQLNSTNLKISQNSCHSTATIGLTQNYKDQPQELNLNKISVKLKHFSSQIEELREMATNLQTKEYKYDSYQIENLKRAMKEIHSELRKLQNQKENISSKLEQNEQKLQKMIEMSKFSQIGSHTEIYPSNNNGNNLSKVSKTNIMRNHSVELSYSDKGYKMSSTGTRSTKNEVPVSETSQLARFSKIPSNNYSNFENLHSHSEFKGFAGEESGFSQYAEESVYNNRRDYKRQQNHEQESFERSEQQSEEAEESQEEDEFFYAVDLKSEQVSQNMINTTNAGMPQKFLPSQTISRFMQVIEQRENKPLRIEIDETGYIKSAENGMYIVDRNMDGFDLNRNELQWLRQNGVIILEK